MKNEIDGDFYCSANFLMIDGSKCNREICGIDGCYENYCPHLHRKHPTPEEFKEEYGEEWSDDGAVYELDKNRWPVDQRWFVGTKKNCGKNSIIVCACTPFGKPDDNWRPE
jgi:hypothetical protein